jgi:hypothetical protein
MIVPKPGKNLRKISWFPHQDGSCVRGCAQFRFYAAAYGNHSRNGSHFDTSAASCRSGARSEPMAGCTTWAFPFSGIATAARRRFGAQTLLYLRGSECSREYQVARSLEVGAETAQTALVMDARHTGSPELPDTFIANDATPRVTSASARKCSSVALTQRTCRCR